MFKSVLCSLFLIIVFNLKNVYSEQFRFDNYKVYKVFPKSDQEINLLQKLMVENNRLDFWNEPVSSAENVLIMVDSQNEMTLNKFFDENVIQNEVIIPNVQTLIDKQNVKKYTRSNLRSMTWDAYYKLDDINSWLDDLNATFPHVTTIIGGDTIEGRQIKGIKISHGPGKKSIFLEGGIHSREWIAPATVNYIAYQLLTSENNEIMEIAREFDWYIFPVTNPDGYIWSHESFRMWRKNRRQVDNTTFGIDLNRNWNSNWLVAGSSSDPTSDSYAGTGPFSEPETRSLADFIRSVSDDMELYLSFHSFSQLLLLPYGNSSVPLDNYHDAINIGRRAMGALSVRHGTQYVTGNIAEAIYEATGGSIDWVKEQLKVPLVYCYELRDRGTFGFLLPADQILPNNEEVMDSLLDIIFQAKRFGYMSSAVDLKGSIFVIVFSVVYALIQ